MTVTWRGPAPSTRLGFNPPLPPHLTPFVPQHQVKDPKTGVYFYEKCLEISRLTGDKRGEMAANNDLGLIYQVRKTPGLSMGLQL